MQRSDTDEQRRRQRYRQDYRGRRFSNQCHSASSQLRGCDLDLTSAEFDLLVFLIDHPKQLITPRTRLATNWSNITVRQTEFLGTLMSLRKKLESSDSAHCYIRTEPWLFYRFDAAASVHS